MRYAPSGRRRHPHQRACAHGRKRPARYAVPQLPQRHHGKRSEYIRWAHSRGGYIVEDDFDSEFTLSSKAEDTLFSLEPKRSVLYLNTFSKTIAPSMRLGYMVLPESLTDAFEQSVGFYSCTVPVFEQYVLAELLSNGDFERHINRVRRRRRKG